MNYYYIFEDVGNLPNTECNWRLHVLRRVKVLCSVGVGDKGARWWVWAGFHFEL